MGSTVKVQTLLKVAFCLVSLRDFTSGLNAHHLHPLAGTKSALFDDDLLPLSGIKSALFDDDLLPLAGIKSALFDDDLLLWLE